MMRNKNQPQKLKNKLHKFQKVLVSITSYDENIERMELELSFKSKTKKFAVPEFNINEQTNGVLIKIELKLKSKTITKWNMLHTTNEANFTY